MAREGKKIQEFDLWTYQAANGNREKKFSATLRMNDSLKFTLEVNGLRFEGMNPSDLVHQATMQLEDEHDLTWRPIILVDCDLEEGRLQFKRLFHAVTRSGKDVWRVWRFDGADEQQHSKWSRSEIETFERLDGGMPGNREGGPRLKDRELPYTPERWTAIMKLDQMLAEAQKAVADKLHEIVRKGDLDGFLAKATQSTHRIFFEETK